MLIKRRITNMKSKGTFTTANTKIEYIEENIDKVGMGERTFFVESQLIFLYIHNVGPTLFRFGGTNVDLIGNVILRSPLAGYLSALMPEQNLSSELEQSCVVEGCK